MNRLCFGHGIHDGRLIALNSLSHLPSLYRMYRLNDFSSLTINESRSPDGEARLVALRQIANFLESAGRLLPSRRFQLGKLGKLGTFVAQRARKKTKL